MSCLESQVGGGPNDWVVGLSKTLGVMEPPMDKNGWRWIVASPWQFLSRNSQALKWSEKFPAHVGHILQFLFEDYIRNIIFFLWGGVGMIFLTIVGPEFANIFFVVNLAK